MQNVGPKNRVVFILLRNPYIGGQKLSNPSLNNNLFLSIFTSLLHSFVVSCLFNHFSLLLFQNIRPFLSISTITVIPLLDHVGFRSLLISTRSFSDPSIFLLLFFPHLGFAMLIARGLMKLFTPYEVIGLSQDRPQRGEHFAVQVISKRESFFQPCHQGKNCHILLQTRKRTSSTLKRPIKSRRDSVFPCLIDNNSPVVHSRRLLLT